MKNWRLIDTDLGDPYYVTAAEEAICSARAKSLVPDTLHFYRRDPPGISVGYFRKIDDDIDIEKANKNNVKIVRRMTGGGTIFTDRNQLIYSIITKNQLGAGVEATFKVVCNAIVDALKNFNIRAEYKPPNDILLNGKKISGSAQTLKKDVVLLHGTVLLATDLKLMNKVLKRPKLDHVTTIQNELGECVPSITAIKNALITSFKSTFDTNIKPGEFTEFETKLIDKLKISKYASNDWNFKR
ncbi:MAG: lipoate--protein ligase family protein [Thermoplasmata archaeon]|nr:lipoate--protein ligase family protein [Thermoplasmata archaeon]